jgi:hypothetical protein
MVSFTSRFKELRGDKQCCGSMWRGVGVMYVGRSDVRMLALTTTKDLGSRLIIQRVQPK